MIEYVATRCKSCKVQVFWERRDRIAFGWWHGKPGDGCEYGQYLGEDHVERITFTEGSRVALCGCRSRCGDDGDTEGPGTCKGLPDPPKPPLVEVVLHPQIGANMTEPLLTPSEKDRMLTTLQEGRVAWFGRMPSYPSIRLSDVLGLTETLGIDPSDVEIIPGGAMMIGIQARS